ncbi:MAG: ATP-dependent Clp protease ATP-binding subunit [Provencibacterium sp.]|nr:ATP-dependent Clp protease ATP-binding subunit [Provencibacterium sp.]
MLCSRCKKRIAVVFMTRLDKGEPINEGLCMKCAKELGIQSVDDLMKKMGISEDELDVMSNQLMEIMSENGEDGFEIGGAQPFPFLQNLFSGQTPAHPPRDGQDAGANLPAVPPQQAGPESGRREQKVGPRREDKKRKYLNAYCENLTDKAREGLIDHVVGRESEIYRVMQILNRRQKNNPCLIGEPGVGKTAIAEGIAQRLAAGEVPHRLQDKELYLLDLTALVAGTQFRGQFESRVKGLVSEIKELGNIILFIDEIHNLVGVGESEGGAMNAANILKPALSRGEVQVIGATTFNEYRKNIEKDAALERRFQPVKVDELNIEETFEVMKGIKEHYEQFHRVSVSEPVLRRMAVLSERYINDRFLPDKAIDLLDESCSCAVMRNPDMAEYDKLRVRVDELNEEIASLESKPDIAGDKTYERLASLKSEAIREQARLSELGARALGAPVTEDDVARVIELWTGIPASKIRESEFKRVSGLEGELKKHIIGQDEAIQLVASAVLRSRVQLSARRRPASFIFVGPTGVGKTELVKVLSRELFDDQEPLIRLDMSEFMEKHSVSRIIGSPPGYVGYDEAGQLTEKVRRRPYSVILFDEIEKAHPDVMNILLQILDEGRITDAQGRNVSFENTVIVMTSNAGADRTDLNLGFNRQPQQVSKERAMKSLREFLRPEFLGRVDEVVSFRPLDETDYQRIAALMLDEMKGPLLERGISLRYDEALLQEIARRAHGQKSGARDITRVIRRDIEDKVCMLVIETMENPPEEICVTAGDGEIRIA